MKHTCALLALLALALLPACQGPVVQVDELQTDVDLTGYTTFGFAPGGSATGDPEPGLDSRIEDALTRELTRRGLRRTFRDQAQLEVFYGSSVEVQQRNLDPYFEPFNNVERFEVGTIWVELVHRRTEELVWSASGRKELRVVQVGSGVSRTTFTDTDEPRRWPVDSIVGELATAIPLPVVQESPE